MEKGVAACRICPRGFYQSISGKVSCNKCPEGFITANNGAYDHRQCEGKSFKSQYTSERTENPSSGGRINGSPTETSALVV